MSAAPVNLDGGPPLPPQLQPAPQASASQLAGPQPQSATPNGSASLQSQVIQQAMAIEKGLQTIATMLPASAGMVSSWIDTFRKGLGSVLSQGAQPPPAQGAPGAGGGLMTMSAPAS